LSHLSPFAVKKMQLIELLKKCEGGFIPELFNRLKESNLGYEFDKC
jgi:hypothetical protein